MIENLFDAPHNASENEFKQLFPLSYSSKDDFEKNCSKKHDQRVQYLWMLYELRGDLDGMANQETRLNDPHYLDEIKYRDTFVDISTLKVM